MAAVVFTGVDESVIVAPATGKASMFVDEANLVSLKLSNGTIIPVGGGGGVAIATGTPPTATSSGTPGTILRDNDFLYICTDTDTWKRTPLSTW